MSLIMQPAIDAIRAAGFTAYQRPKGETYLFFTDGTRIAYLEWDRLAAAFKASTVHVPNRQSGTGFSLGHVSDLSPEALETLLAIHAPGWAYRDDRESVVKWRDWEHFANSSTFNKEYRAVEGAAA